MSISWLVVTGKWLLRGSFSIKGPSWLIFPESDKTYTETNLTLKLSGIMRLLVCYHPGLKVMMRSSSDVFPSGVFWLWQQEEAVLAKMNHQVGKSNFLQEQHSGSVLSSSSVFSQNESEIQTHVIVLQLLNSLTVFWAAVEDVRYDRTVEKAVRRDITLHI